MREQSTEQRGTEATLVALKEAINRHDVAGVVACFSENVRSEQPRHPDRSFTGRAAVEKNWSANFALVPDFRAELLRTATDGSVAWAEWRWSGTQTDGRLLDLRGVTVFGVVDGLIEWARLYMDPVEPTR